MNLLIGLKDDSYNFQSIAVDIGSNVIDKWAK